MHDSEAYLEVFVQITEVFLCIFMNFLDVGKPLFIMRFLIFPISCCFESKEAIILCVFSGGYGFWSQETIIIFVISYLLVFHVSCIF